MCVLTEQNAIVCPSSLPPSLLCTEITKSSLRPVFVGAVNLPIVFKSWYDGFLLLSENHHISCWAILSAPQQGDFSSLKEER